MCYMSLGSMYQRIQVLKIETNKHRRPIYVSYNVNAGNKSPTHMGNSFDP